MWPVLRSRRIRISPFLLQSSKKDPAAVFTEPRPASGGRKRLPRSKACPRRAPTGGVPQNSPPLSQDGQKQCALPPLCLPPQGRPAGYRAMPQRISSKGPLHESQRSVPEQKRYAIGWTCFPVAASIKRRNSSGVPPCRFRLSYNWA